MKYTAKREELMRRARAELGEVEEPKADWLDYLSISFGVGLLVWIIGRAVFTI